MDLEVKVIELQMLWQRGKEALGQLTIGIGVESIKKVEVEEMLGAGPH